MKTSYFAGRYSTLKHFHILHAFRNSSPKGIQFHVKNLSQILQKSVWQRVQKNCPYKNLQMTPKFELWLPKGSPRRSKSGPNLRQIGAWSCPGRPWVPRWPPKTSPEASGPQFLAILHGFDVAGPAKLFENARKPHCDWVMQTQTPVAVGFSCIF